MSGVLYADKFTLQHGTGGGSVAANARDLPWKVLKIKARAPGKYWK